MNAQRDIRTGLVGLVVQGQLCGGRFLKIQDDRAGSTGGLYVLWCDDPAFAARVFDDWVEDWPALERYFDELALEVQWPREGPAP